LNPEKILKLLEFDTPTVANGLEKLEVQDPSAGYTGPDVRALMPDMGPRIGVVVTARMDTTTAGTDRPASMFHDWLRMIHKATQGDFFAPWAGRTAGLKAGRLARPMEQKNCQWPVFAVMESVGPRVRHTVTIGDGMGTMMKLAGAVAFLTNGCIRDLEGVRAVPLPCWAAGLTPMHGRLRWLDIGSPVVIDGMTVRPGDIIHADVNGAIVIPPRVADQVYEKAVAVREFEQKLFARLRAPGMTIEKYLAEQSKP